jgi:hypothetical protein
LRVRVPSGLPMEYRIENYIRPATFGEVVSDLNKLDTNSNISENVFRITHDMLLTLQWAVGKENVRSELEVMMSNENIPKDIQEKYLNQFNIGV